jgi:pimeloyl-ACP methyl ester carboxylesterase
MASVVLVHGAWGSPAELSPVEPALVDAGHRVVIVDLPCTDPSATLQDYADTVMAAIDGLECVVLVGHSFGGAVISLVREQRPDTALVFVTAVALEPGQSLLQLLLGDDPFENPENADPWSAFDGLIVNCGPGMCALNLEMMASSAPDDQREDVLAALQATQRDQGVAVLREGWPGIALPQGQITYVIATNDSMIPPELQSEMAASLGADVHRIESDHEMFGEQPDALAAVLLGVAAQVDRQANP